MRLPLAAICAPNMAHVHAISGGRQTRPAFDARPAWGDGSTDAVVNSVVMPAKAGIPYAPAWRQAPLRQQASASTGFRLSRAVRARPE
jgi:hypothetical protein